jgi:ornithine cyclodeaminase/alanine dehydrogenase-like protein (mu-crystallin family)
MPAADTPLFIDQALVSELLSLDAAVHAIREIYADPALESEMSPTRSIARGAGARLRAMAAILPSGDVMGTKLVVHSRSMRPRFLIAVFSQEDGSLRGLLDGNVITTLRTAATSAVAVDALSQPGPLRAGILGSAGVARAHARAIAVVRPFEELCVYSTTEANRDAFAHEIGAELGVECATADSARELVERSTTVVAAARANREQPVLDSAWLQDGSLVVSVGSTLPEQRELDTATLERATLIVADDPREVLTGSGDCLAATDESIDIAARTIDLAAAVRDPTYARTPRPLTVYKSVGSALQDIAVARLVLALAKDRARPLPMQLAVKGA